MNGLTVKDVNFNGAMLRAAQDINSVIWVGVSWVCNGIGLSKNQKDRQVKNIQSDKLLSEGCVKFDAGVFDENNETLALMLDYLPAWLFKIKITPKMERENPKLANILLQYQLKAKDVLAEAFLGKQKEEIIPQQNTQTIQLQMPSYDTQFAELKQQMNNLYSDMGKFVQIVLEWKNSFEKNVLTNGIEEKKNNISISHIPSESKIWKQKIYGMINCVLDNDIRFSDANEVMKYIYDYMRKNYGVVWEQEIKEYIEINNCGKKPSTIDIVYENEMYRSIFESVLSDITKNNMKTDNHSIKRTDDIIRPLIEKYQDRSNAGMITYRIVYRHMEENNNIVWKNRETRYINKYGAKTLSKKNMINASSTLMKMFVKSVNELLEEK